MGNNTTSLKSYIGIGKTENESVQNLVNQIGGYSTIDMESRSLVYKNKTYFVYTLYINTDIWHSVIL